MHVVVVGAGLLGTVTAYLLAARGCEVTVLEKRAGPALETSFANAGMLTPSQADPWNAPGFLWKVFGWIGREDAPMLLRARAVPSLLGWGVGFALNSLPERYRRNMLANARMAHFSLQVMARLRAELALEYDARTLGTLKVFRTQKAFEHACGIAAEIATAGVRCEPLGPREVVAREPALADVESRLAGGLYYPDDESGDAHRFTVAVSGAAADRGVDLRFNTSVQRLEVSGGRLAGVVTGAGRVTGDSYVLAAGPWSRKLARGAGLRLPIMPVKGYSITLPPDGAGRRPGLPVIDDTLHAAVTPLGEHLRVAGTAEFAGYDRRLSQGRIANLYALLRALYPAIRPPADPMLAAPWAGLRPMSCDGVPLIGPTAIRNLFLNTGHGHLGWSMCAGSAQALVEHMLDGRSAIDLSAYAADRFGFLNSSRI